MLSFILGSSLIEIAWPKFYWPFFYSHNLYQTMKAYPLEAKEIAPDWDAYSKENLSGKVQFIYNLKKSINIMLHVLVSSESVPVEARTIASILGTCIKLSRSMFIWTSKLQRKCHKSDYHHIPWFGSNIFYLYQRAIRQQPTKCLHKVLLRTFHDFNKSLQWQIKYAASSPL